MDSIYRVSLESRDAASCCHFLVSHNNQLWYWEVENFKPSLRLDTTKGQPRLIVTISQQLLAPTAADQQIFYYTFCIFVLKSRLQEATVKHNCILLIFLCKFCIQNLILHNWSLKLTLNPGLNSRELRNFQYFLHTFCLCSMHFAYFFLFLIILCIHFAYILLENCCWCPFPHISCVLLILFWHNLHIA